MPRQNTRPQAFPLPVLQQIEQLAAHIASLRKQRGETQAQWAQQLGISQPTMARLERGDPSIATATYVMCLWQLNPQLNLLQLLPAPAANAMPTQPAHTATSTTPFDDFAQLLQQWPAPSSTEDLSAIPLA